MEKAPYKVLIEFQSDEALTFTNLMCRFGYYLKDDPRLCYMDSPCVVPLPEELNKAAHAIFDFVADTGCQTHGTIPLKEAKKIKSIEFVEREMAKVEAVDLKDMVVPPPLAHLVAQRTIEVLAQKAANDSHIQKAAETLKTSPFLKDEPAPLPKVSALDKLKKYLPWILL